MLQIPFFIFAVLTFNDILLSTLVMKFWVYSSDKIPYLPPGSQLRYQLYVNFLIQ